MSPSAPEKSTLERILDAGVYAPLGYVLRRDEVRNDLAEVGRKQVAFARSLGRAALKGMGRGKKPAQDASSASQAPPTPKPASATAQAAQPTPQVTTAELAGYSDMTARDIVAWLRTASADQARWVMTEETAGKQRVTVLRAAATEDG